MSDEDEFWSLKPSLRRAIDTTFLKLVKLGNESSGEPAQKKRRTRQEDEEDSGGGFVPGDSGHSSDNDQGEQSSISLSLIPTGLQMLDLPPDDQEVLTVFRNAATGWENARPKTRAGAEETVDRDAGLTVSKDDWRAVCGVLLGQTQEGEEEEPESATRTRRKPTPAQSRPATGEGRQTRSKAKAKIKAKAPEPEPDSDEGGGFVVDRDEDEGAGFEPEEEEAESDSDRYSEPGDEDDEDDASASEFGDRPKSRRARKAEDFEDLELDADDLPFTLTERQKREVRFAFALFFPDMDPNDPALDTKKIGIQEVGDAAKVLKEKLLTEDIIEMLSMFSSGPSGKVGLDEFGRMAVMAKLV